MNSLLIKTHRKFTGISRSVQTYRYSNKFSNEWPHLKWDKQKIGHLIEQNRIERPLDRIVPCVAALHSSATGLSIRSNWTYNIGGGNGAFSHPQLQSTRHIHLSTIRYEAKPSKVEESIKKIQEKEKEKDLPKPVASSSMFHAPVVVKKTLKQRIVQELMHYYHGFRLLFIDINIARKLVWKVLNGKTLTRREYMLLIRTTGDVFRLVPFSVFIIVPFMEFLLPFYIKFLPGMLPSTFESASDKETKVRNQLKVKLDMAKFLQKTLNEMDLQHNDHRSEEAKAFIEFFNKLRSPDQHVRVTPKEIIKFSKLFEDEITLDSLSRDQLTAICKVLEINTLGPINLLRFQLRIKLRSLAADDQMIQREGIDSLTLSELQAACRARGMRSYGLSQAQLKFQLSEWIDLSLNEKVPPSLLLLSRAMLLPEDVLTADKLKASISVLPDSAAVQTKAAIGEREGKIDNKTKIDILRDEERKIKEEIDDLQEVQDDIQKKAEVLLDKAPILSADTAATPFSSKDIEAVSTAIDEVSKTKHSLLMEKEEIKDLKEEIAEYKEDVQELQEISKQSPINHPIKESKASKMLLKRVDKMISRLDNTLIQLEMKEADLQAKLKEAEIDPDAQKSELVHIDEIMMAIKKMQKVSDEAKLDQIGKLLGKMDDDKDGHLKIDDLLKIIETIGKDNVNLTERQIDDLIELISKEEQIENEEKIKKMLAKSKEEQDAKDKAEELVDTAATILDNDTLKCNDEANDKAKTKPQKPIDELINKSVIMNAKEAAERQKDKILPLSSNASDATTKTPQIKGGGSSTNTNNQDKML